MWNPPPDHRSLSLEIPSMFSGLIIMGQGLVSLLINLFGTWAKVEASLRIALLFVSLLAGILHLVDRRRRKRRAPRPMRSQSRLPLAIACLLLLSLSACTVFRSAQVETRLDGTKVESHQLVATVWDSQSTLSKLHVSTTDKAQSLNIGSLAEASQSTNLNSIVESAVGAAVRAAKP